MRLLMLSPHPTVDGPLPKHTPLLIEALRDRGCVVQSEGWGRHSDRQTSIARGWSRIRDIVRFRQIVRHDRFDLVVVKTSHNWTAIARDIPLLLALRGGGRVIVLQFHGGELERLTGPGARLFKLASRVLLTLADGVLVLSSEEARAGAGFYPAGRFFTVLNPFQPREEADGAPPAGSDESHVPSILFAGRLIEQKGIFDTLDAFSAVRRRRPCRLVIAGGGPAAQMVSQRVAELGLVEDVLIAGQLDASELLAMYHQTDVFVLPTYWGEGFPTVISEAMSAGLPIVTTRLRGMADHLAEHENALFVAPRSPSELAVAVERLLSDPALRAQMGAANRQKVKEFAPPTVGAKYLAALNAIAADRSASA